MRNSLVKSGIICLAVFTAIMAAGMTAEARGFPPLVSAAHHGDVEKVRALLQKGADVNAKENHGFTALYFAVSGKHKETKLEKQNRLEIVRLLLAAGADANGSGGSRPLSIAAREPNLDMVKLLLANGADVNAVNGGGRTILFLAAGTIGGDRDGVGKAVSLLVEHGADVNKLSSVDSDGNTTPLMSAAWNGCYSCAKVLVANGADVNAANEGGGTALTSAAGLQGNGPKILKLLLDNGADAHAKNKDGKDAEALIDGRALSYEIKKAATGDAFAQYKLFRKYSRYPRAIIRQAKVDMWAGKAHDSFRTLAGKGDAKGQYYLGFMEFYGQGVKADTANGLRSMTKAAEAGSSNAQWMLGVIYSKGSHGVGIDKAAAIRWHEMAAAQGSKASRKALKKLRE